LLEMQCKRSCNAVPFHFLHDKENASSYDNSHKKIRFVGSLITIVCCEVAESEVKCPSSTS